ncbi:MAG TPA: hypothetical protein VGI95_21405 [Caulobacteraceae bacterium]|jgi:hypothetical protein
MSDRAKKLNTATEQVDAVASRNLADLNASIRVSREEVARGIFSPRTVADIISDGRKRHGSR